MIEKLHGSKGQAAVEFLITYGWAFILILISLGVLAYFGAFTPETYLPDTCIFPQELSCSDYQIATASVKNQTFIDLVNNFGRPINISNASIYTHQFGIGDCANTSFRVINASEKITLACDLKGTVPSTKIRIFANVTYSRPGSSRFHTLKGELFAEASLP